MMQLAECFLKGTGEGLLIDNASRALLEETAVALHALTADVLQAVHSTEIEGMIESTDLKASLRASAQATNDSSGKTLTQIQVRRVSFVIQ